jgi:hypothetical protein
MCGWGRVFFRIKQGIFCGIWFSFIRVLLGVTELLSFRHCEDRDVGSESIVVGY